ncbi:MAG: hypothetical protein ACK417_04125 [Bacteroidia bacterium]
MNRILTCAVFCLISFGTNAQILNAEAFQSQNEPTEKWRGQTAFGLNLDKQASLIYSAFTDVDVSYRIRNKSLLSASRMRVTGNGEELLLNGGFFHFRLRDNTGKNQLLEHYTQYQWDGIRGLKNRYILGSNIRQRVQHDSLGSLYAGFGVFYEFEQWGYAAVPAKRRPDLTEDIFKNLIKFNLYVRFFRKIAPNLRFSTVFYYQARPEYFFAEHRLAGNFELIFQVSKNFEFRLNYDGIYDTAPVVPIDEFYFTLSNRFVFRF